MGQDTGGPPYDLGVRAYRHPRGRGGTSSPTNQLDTRGRRHLAASGALQAFMSDSNWSN